MSKDYKRPQPLDNLSDMELVVRIVNMTDAQRMEIFNEKDIGKIVQAGNVREKIEKYVTEHGPQFHTGDICTDEDGEIYVYIKNVDSAGMTSQVIARKTGEPEHIDTSKLKLSRYAISWRTIDVNDGVQILKRDDRIYI